MWFEEYLRRRDICKSCNERKKCNSIKADMFTRLSSGIMCEKWEKDK